MKGYRKPSGVYIQLEDTVPVSDTLVEVALRPQDSEFADNWDTDPLNESVCWRPKTTAELSSEEDTQKRALFTEREDTTLLLFFELTNIVRVLEGKSKITKQQFWTAVKKRHKNQQFFDF